MSLSVLNKCWSFLPFSLSLSLFSPSLSLSLSLSLILSSSLGESTVNEGEHARFNALLFRPPSIPLFFFFLFLFFFFCLSFSLSLSLFPLFCKGADKTVFVTFHKRGGWGVCEVVVFGPGVCEVVS